MQIHMLIKKCLQRCDSVLDAETKKRIDTARDLLVGKVPDPKSQIEQITIALIYKFMSDIEKNTTNREGNPSYFIEEYAKYSWDNVVNSLRGDALVEAYRTAIETMDKNNGLSPLFRDVFKNANLPYKDSATLMSFLRTINEFTYSADSEALGDAFEYLLSVMGSQGNAGQFRTPRHIIDFMVEVVSPEITETILDPACGTAGFFDFSF